MLNKYSSNFRIFLNIIGPYKKITIALFIIMLLAAIFEALGLSMIVPLLGTILDNTAPGEEGHAIVFFNNMMSRYVPEDMRILTISLIFLSIFIIKNIIIYARSVMAVYYQSTLRKHWSTSMLNKYIRAEYEYITSSRKGALINNLFNETFIAAKFVGKMVAFFSKLLTALCIYCLLLFVNWYLTLFLSAILAVFFGLFWKISKKSVDSMGKKRLAMLQTATAEGEEALDAVRQIKLFSLEKFILKEFSQMFNVIRNLFVKMSFYLSLPIPLGEIFIISCFVAIILYFEYFGNISIVAMLPMMAFALISSARLYQNISTLVSGRLWFQANFPSINLISTILAGKEIKKETLSNGVKIEKLEGDILFKDVTFSYNNSRRILKNLNLRIQKNKITAIVGKSGSGKTTFVDLLCGLYKGYKGEIMCGDRKFSDLNLFSWRKIIGFVSQDTFLFNTSVKENILFGKPESTEEDILIAAKMANAHEFIMKLPKAYDTVLGDRGLTLSGGQRQRLTIARALIRSPELLIFDEATSSLDTESERLIHESIESLRNNKTIIIISHRLSTIKSADLIHVIDNGNIVESGTYEELINRQGFFSSMALQQT